MEMVVPAGNAPASPAYRAGALLLSYGTMAEGVGNAPTSVGTDPLFETGAASPESIRGQLVSACLPQLAARVGLAPTPNGLTGRHATLTTPGNGAAGRIPTCMSPLRRRMPDVFGHGSNLKLVSAAGLAPAIPRSQAERVAPTLRAGGGPEGSCTLNPPADNGALC